MNKILFVGDLNEYGRSFQRCRALEDLGCFVKKLSTVPEPFIPGIQPVPLIDRILWKLGAPRDLTCVNKKIKGFLNKEQFDIVWIEKGVTIRPDTLLFIRKLKPRPKVISLSEDDMYARHNQSLFYRRGLKFYDIVFTTKVYNLQELKLLGAKRTELFLDAYDEKLHRPVQLTESEKEIFGCDVGFIGTFEEVRAKKMLYLARNGIKVVVWGNGWNKWQDVHPLLVIKNQPIYGEDYVKAINAIKINLCFLRKINRDEVTSRSVEIPACGGFMLAERTKRHLEFFEEDKEAVFFGSKEELLSKVRYYLVNNDSRQKIAAAGRVRCVKSGYNHRSQLQKMLSLVGRL